MKKLFSKPSGLFCFGLLSGVIVILFIFWIIVGPIAGAHYRREVQRRNDVIAQTYEFARHAAELFVNRDKQGLFEIIWEWEWTEDDPFEESLFILPEGLYLEFVDLRRDRLNSGWDTGRFFHRVVVDRGIFTSFNIKFRVIGDLPDDMGHIPHERIRVTEIDGERVYEIFVMFFISNSIVDGEWSLYSIRYSQFFF